jgi:NAD(P) transhydrogenase subunit alpha
LQAIATAKRLGAKVQAYAVRSAVKEQVESVGAKFVELPLETGEAEDKGGYAKELAAAKIQQQQELMAEVVAHNDVVITTAMIPGKKAPLLLTAAMVKRMHPSSVIVDLAAERGGNCELTRPGETVVVKRSALSRQPDVQPQFDNPFALPGQRRPVDTGFGR